MNRQAVSDTPRRVVVASGTSRMRDSLQIILNSADVLQVVRVVATGSQLMTALLSEPAGLIIIDSDLPGLCKVDLEEQLSAGHFSGQLLYLHCCRGDDILPLIRSFGGVVIDRCTGATEFLETVLSLVN